MATQNIQVTRDPQELIAALSLVTGDTYILQNTGEYTISHADLAAAPTDNESVVKLLLFPGETRFWEMPGTGGFYVWVPGTVQFLSSLSVNESS